MKSIKELGIKSTDAFQKASYWDNNGAYQKEGKELYAKFVPAEGAAETTHGELIRGITRLFYEYCNNGNCNAVNVLTPNDHPYDFDDEEDCVDWDEIEEVHVSAYYEKFLTLIENTLIDKIDTNEVYKICADVREVIEAGAYNLSCSKYFIEENINKYNRMCDVVIWYVLNTADKALPYDYKRS